MLGGIRITFLLRKMVLPIFVGVVSAALAFAWQKHSSYSDFRTIVVGGALFCVFMVLINYIQVSWQAYQMKTKLAAVFGLEDNLLRRIQQVETGQYAAETIKIMDGRLAELEIIATAKNNTSNNGANLETSTDDYSDKNVVRLDPNRAFSKSPPGKTNSPRRAIKAAIAKSVSEKQITIQLQPIIDLMSKEIVAVDAIGTIKVGNEFVAVSDLMDSFNDQQRCDYDLEMITVLSKVARKMDKDGQLLPIHTTFLSGNVINHHTWSKLISLLKADSKLASMLVPQLKMTTFGRMDEEKVSRFLELKEFGLEPSMIDCAEPDKILRLVRKKPIHSIKIPVTELLKYTSKEGERCADVLLPRLAKLGIEPIATHIEKAHQAANLIDLDVTLGQGDFISPPRAINLGDFARPPIANTSGKK